jgi:hypothetical protein
MSDRKLTITRALDIIPGSRAPEPDDPGQSPPAQVMWEISGPEEWVRSFIGRHEFPVEELGPEAAAYPGWLATHQGGSYAESQGARAWGFAVMPPG